MKNPRFKFRFSLVSLRPIIALGLLIVASWVVVGQRAAKDAIVSNYSQEKDLTTVYLKPIKLESNADDFRVGAAYEYSGQKLTAQTCCFVITFSANAKKHFLFKEKHKLTLWVDNERIDIDDVVWREPDEATAFIVAGIAYPESLFAGIISDQFETILHAKKVKAQLGDFKFTLTPEQLTGFKLLWDSMKIEPAG